jgi:hypothetical protein
VALAGDFDAKPYTTWDERTVLRVLTDSPWSKPVTVSLTWVKREQQPASYKDIPGANGTKSNSSLGPLGGIGAPKPKYPTKADLLVRWVSALPVRQATGVYRQRTEKLDQIRTNEIIGADGDDYVLEIFGAPVELAHSGAESVEAIAVSAVTIRTAAGRLLKPTSAKVTLQGETLAIRVHFPRTLAVQPDDRELEVSADFQIFPLKVRFRLSAMTYLGRLAL